MKTIEEKAKAYDEIIERAKTMLSAGEVMYGKENNASQLITDLIPELRESEDERMMREFNDWLCEEIECRTNDLRDEKDRRTLNMLCYVLTKVKDWLEKQKESLHISESCKENADSFTSEDERIRKDLIYDIERLPMQGVLTHRSTNEYIAYLEKQKDASYAIEAVDRIDKYIDEHLANAHDMKDSNPDKKYYRGWDDALGEMAGILQDVYSEEKPKEQKPAWSEEDEDMLEYIIGDVNDAKQLYTTQEAKDMADKEIAWLKSLRPCPSWKPSEEQMKHLEYYVSTGSISLKSLYNDLLKLK